MIQKHTVHNLSSIHTHQTMTTIAFHRRACLEWSRRYSLTIPAKKKKNDKKILTTTKTQNNYAGSFSFHQSPALFCCCYVNDEENNSTHAQKTIAQKNNTLGGYHYTYKVMQKYPSQLFYTCHRQSPSGTTFKQGVIQFQSAK